MFAYKLLFIALLFICQKTLAQNREIDSLQQILDTASTDTAKIHLFNKMSSSLWNSHPQISMEAAQKALHLSEKLNYQNGIKIAYNNIGVIHDYQGNYPEALQCFLKTLAICEQSDDIKTMASTLNNIGVLYESLGDYEQALQYYERSLVIKKQLEDQHGMALAYNNLGGVYSALGKEDKGLNYHLKALQMREALGYSRGIANSLNNIGRIYVSQGKLHEALACFEKSYTITREIDDKLGHAYSLQNLALVFHEQKNYQKALFYAQTSYSIAQEINAKIPAKEASKLLFQTYQALRNYKMAFKYQSLYMSYHDSLRSEANKRKIAHLQSSYEIQKRDAEIALLNKDNRLHEAEARRLGAEAERKNLFLFASATFLIFLTVLAITLVRYNQQQKRANLLLSKKNEEIKISNLHLKMKNTEIELRNKEISNQKKILEDLNGIKDRLFSIIAHDFRSPLNSLQGTLSLLQLEAISYDEIKKVLPSIIKKVDYTVSLLDNLLNWSRAQMPGMKTVPVTFDLQSVTEETVHLLKSQAKEKNVLLHNMIPLAIPVYADPEMIKLVIRNLISNAIKFTNPGDMISIKVRDTDEYCQLTIADTGCGIDKSKLRNLFTPGNNSTLGTSNEKGTGLGLLICKDFVEKNGGDIWAESEKGKGSIFYFTIPKSSEAVTKKSVALA